MSRNNSIRPHQAFLASLLHAPLPPLTITDVRAFAAAYLTNEYSPHPSDHGVRPASPATRVPATLPPQPDRWINVGRWAREMETGERGERDGGARRRGRDDWRRVEEVVLGMEEADGRVVERLRAELSRFGELGRFSRQRTKLEERGEWVALVRRVLLDREMIRMVWGRVPAAGFARGGGQQAVVAAYLESYVQGRFRFLRSEGDFELTGATRLRAGMGAGLRRMGTGLSMLGAFDQRPQSIDGLSPGNLLRRNTVGPASRTNRPPTPANPPRRDRSRDRRARRHRDRTQHHYHTDLIPASELILNTPTERLLRRTNYHHACTCGALHQLHLTLDIRPEAQMRTGSEPEYEDRLPGYEELLRDEDVLAVVEGEQRIEEEEARREEEEVLAEVLERQQRRRERQRPGTAPAPDTNPSHPFTTGGPLSSHPCDPPAPGPTQTGHLPPRASTRPRRSNTIPTRPPPGTSDDSSSSSERGRPSAREPPLGPNGQGEDDGGWV